MSYLCCKSHAVRQSRNITNEQLEIFQGLYRINDSPVMICLKAFFFFYGRLATRWENTDSRSSVSNLRQRRHIEGTQKVFSVPYAVLTKWEKLVGQASLRGRYQNKRAQRYLWKDCGTLLISETFEKTDISINHLKFVFKIKIHSHIHELLHTYISISLSLFHSLSFLNSSFLNVFS